MMGHKELGNKFKRNYFISSDPIVTSYYYIFIIIFDNLRPGVDDES